MRLALTLALTAALAFTSAWAQTDRLTKTAASKILLIDAARAGNRIVAVGDRGFILASDDNGDSWRRLNAPEGPLLTAVFFLRDAKTGYFTIMGRIDDVLNVSGHRMGTMEIESALVSNPMVAEAAVVGRPDDLTGEAICAFVVLKQARPGGEEARKIANELRNWVGKEIGPIAKPKDIRFGENLPKTRSGKIMRRLLRSIAKGEAITQDTSTLENPAILEQLAQVN